MIKVYLRRKKISKGRRSLYLDFYPPVPHRITGKPSRREFLGLYTYDKPRDTFDKEHNKEVNRIARAIQVKRENELNKPEIYTAEEQEKLRQMELGDRDFIQFCHLLADKRSGANQGNWRSAIKHFTEFVGDSVRFADLSEILFNDFKDSLLESKLSQNIAASYFAKIRRALREAFREGILQTDLVSRIEGIKEIAPIKEYLTFSVTEILKACKSVCYCKQVQLRYKMVTPTPSIRV